MKSFPARNACVYGSGMLADDLPMNPMIESSATAYVRDDDATGSGHAYKGTSDYQSIQLAAVPRRLD